MSVPPSLSQGVSVQVRGLRKSYDDRLVVCDVNLEVARGETFVIIGPSGSGKTVLLKHIIGLETPDAGDILIEGESIRSPGVMDRYRLAMVFQSGALLNSLTVGENVGLYLAEHGLNTPGENERIVAEKLALVGLQGEEGKFPNELSGGMKKRVAIARALVIDPQLILYDEPTSELDPVMAVTVYREMLHLKNRLRATSFIVTHDRDLAFAVADRVGVMQAGQILLVGTPAEVRNSADPVVQRFLTVGFDNPVPK